MCVCVCVCVCVFPKIKKMAYNYWYTRLCLQAVPNMCTS